MKHRSFSKRLCLTALLIYVLGTSLYMYKSPIGDLGNPIRDALDILTSHISYAIL